MIIVKKRFWLLGIHEKVIFRGLKNIQKNLRVHSEKKLRSSKKCHHSNKMLPRGYPDENWTDPIPYRFKESWPLLTIFSNPLFSMVISGEWLKFRPNFCSGLLILVRLKIVRHFLRSTFLTDKVSHGITEWYSKSSKSVHTYRTSIATTSHHHQQYHYTKHHWS